MPALTPIIVTDATGATIAIPSSNSRLEVLLRIVGDRTFMGFNENAVDEMGIFADQNDIITLANNKAASAIKFVCAAGETSTVYVETTNAV